MADLGMLINIRADGSINASNDIDKVSGSADTLEKKAKIAGKATDDLAGRVERAGKEASKTSSSFGLLGKAVGGFISVMAIKNTLAIADSYGQISARIKLEINDMSEYDYVQNRLLKTANATQRSLSQSYSSIQVGTSEIWGTP